MSRFNRPSSRPSPAPSSGGGGGGGGGGRPASSRNAWSRPLQQNNRNTKWSGGSGGGPAPPPGLRGPPSGGGGGGGGGIPRNNSNHGSGTKPQQPTGHVHETTILRERFLHLTLSMVGHNVVVTQTNGAVLEGILHTFTPFSSQPAERKNMYVVKACRSVRDPVVDDDNKDAGKVESVEEGGGPLRSHVSVVEDGCTVIIPVERVESVHVKSMRIDTATNGAATGGNGAAAATQNDLTGGAGNGPAVTHDPFRTDTDISGMKGGQGRDLVVAGSAWTSGGDGGGPGPANKSRADALMGGSLEESGGGASSRRWAAAAAGGPAKAGGGPSSDGGLKGSIGNWDQFRANEQRFGVKASFDESLYTTELRKEEIASHKVEEAERLAKEIESTVSTNVHIAEERGQAIQTDYDEEDLYSGVLTSGGKVRAALEATVPNTTSAEGDKAAVSVSKAEKDKTTATANVPHQSLDQPKPKLVQPVKKMNYAAAAAKAEVKVNKAPVATTSKKADSDAKKPPVALATADASGKVDKEAVAKVEVESAGAAASKDAQTKKGEDAGKDSSAEKAKGEKGKAEDSLESPEEKKDAVEPTEASKVSSSDAGEGSGKGVSKPPTTDSGEKKKTSKLNANAKEFTFNPSAKSFTPGGFGGGAPAPVPPPEQAQQPPMVDAAAGGGVHGMVGPGGVPPQYMHHPAPISGGMMMMNAHYAAGMRYTGGGHPYGSMGQHAPPVQQPQQPQHVQVQTPQSGQEGATPSGQEQNQPQEPQPQPQQEGQEQQQQQSQQQQHPATTVPYSVPGPAPYYGGVMMHPHARGPHMGGFPQQMVGGPQHIPMMPGGSPYRTMYGAGPAHMQPGGGMPNMQHGQMRGPGGGYYGNPGAPGGMPYPPSAGYSGVPGGHGGNMDDGGDHGYRGGGGRGGGGRAGGRGHNRRHPRNKNGRGNGGRGGYHHQHQHGGGGNTSGQQQGGSAGDSDSKTSGSDGEKHERDDSVPPPEESGKPSNEKNVPPPTSDAGVSQGPSGEKNDAPSEK